MVDSIYTFLFKKLYMRFCGNEVQIFRRTVSRVNWSEILSIVLLAFFVNKNRNCFFGFEVIACLLSSTARRFLVTLPQF